MYSVFWSEYERALGCASSFVDLRVVQFLMSWLREGEVAFWARVTIVVFSFVCHPLGVCCVPFHQAFPTVLGRFVFGDYQPRLDGFLRYMYPFVCLFVLLIVVSFGLGF